MLANQIAASSELELVERDSSSHLKWSAVASVKLPFTVTNAGRSSS